MIVNPHQSWRYIPLINAPGSVQMAIDNWLLENHRLAQHSSILRFYTWSPPAISLGYHQHHFPEFWQHLTWKGQPLDLVRRPTGGRAVLHQGDLTYMVVTSGISGKQRQVYHYLCQFLLQGWQNLGINLSFGQRDGGYIRNPNCFGTATEADLVTSGGDKLIGSAQLRRGKAILQHGSMVLRRDEELLAHIFGLDTQAKVQQPRHDLSIPTILHTLKQAACDCFGMELVTQPLSKQEWQEISGSI